jgi:hypothetical protein
MSYKHLVVFTFPAMASSRIAAAEGQQDLPIKDGFAGVNGPP